MGDGAAEWSRGRPLRVDVNELMIERGVGKPVDPLLIDGQPLAGLALPTGQLQEL